MPITRVKDGREWLIGNADDVAWIAEATELGSEIACGIPTAFEAYGTVGLPEGIRGAQRQHDRTVLALLEANSEHQPWWLGYLETGLGVDVVFYDAPRVKVYEDDWDYVLVQAGSEQALRWRDSEGHRAPRKGALPDLMFPTDHSWLFSTLWDDEWSCIGGSDALIASFADDPQLGVRTRVVACDRRREPPGRQRG